MADKRDLVEEKLVEIKRRVMDVKASSGGAIREKEFAHVSMTVFAEMEFLLKLVEKLRKRPIEVPVEEQTEAQLLGDLVGAEA